ncbi:MAG: YceI family protein [Acetobacteraceae bacterium]
MRRVTAALLLTTLASPPADAAPRAYRLDPGSTTVSFRAYGLGLIPIEGKFTRFSGTMTLDAADTGFCRIEVHAEAASLEMPDASMTADALGADLLDAGRYKDVVYTGDCMAGTVNGVLLLHGVSRPLALRLDVSSKTWTATGPMRRADWGMGARPLLAGPEVRLQITAALPAGFPTPR